MERFDHNLHHPVSTKRGYGIRSGKVDRALAGISQPRASCVAISETYPRGFHPSVPSQPPKTGFEWGLNPNDEPVPSFSIDDPEIGRSLANREEPR